MKQNIKEKNIIAIRIRYEALIGLKEAACGKEIKSLKNSTKEENIYIYETKSNRTEPANICIDKYEKRIKCQMTPKVISRNRA